MNIDSFDATLYTSSTECLQALSQENIVLGRRLGARVFGLASRGIRFSYAFLDEVAQNGELSRCLADNAWNELNAAQAVAVESLLEKYSTSCRTVSNGATLLVYLADEAPTQLVAAPAQETTVSLVPKVLGIGGNLTVPGLLWDKKRLEESALTLLDSDDDQRLIEAFRYLFRAAMAAGQNPLGLIENVLRRGRTKVSLEAALMVRDNLNRELGRALQGLLSEDAQNIKDGLLYFTESASGPYAATCQAIVLPALIPLTQSTAFRTILLPSLPRLAKLLGSCVDLQDDASLRLMTAFLDALLSDLENMQLQERFAVSAFMFDFAPFYPPLKDYLLQQLRATLNADMQAFYGNILARLEPDEATRSEVNQCLVKLFAQHGGEVGMGRRLRATFRALGELSLQSLCDPQYLSPLNDEQRIQIVHLWKEFRAEALSDTLQQLFAAFVCERLTACDRAVLFALLRTQQLDLPEVQAALPQAPEPRQIYVFLFEEASRIEEPDDEPLLNLLPAFGEQALEYAFASVREETALHAGGEGGRLRAFARLLGRCNDGQDNHRREQIAAMASEILGAEGLRENPAKPFLPVVWQGLGELGANPCLSETLQLAVVERLAVTLADRNAQVKVQALLRVYRSGSENVQRRIETMLREVLTAQQPNRYLLKYCLEGLEALLNQGVVLRETEELAAGLCRTVLAKAHEVNLQDVMLAALQDQSAEPTEPPVPAIYNSDGEKIEVLTATSHNGVRISEAWNLEDRGWALRILGRLAENPRLETRLRRMMGVRLFSFLDDWFDNLESGQNPYACRSNPLWQVLSGVLLSNPPEPIIDLARQACVRLLSCHRRGLEGWDLSLSESAQRFMMTVLRVSKNTTVKVGGLDLELDRALLRLELELARTAPPESGATVHMLHHLAEEKCLPTALQSELEAGLKVVIARRALMPHHN